MSEEPVMVLPNTIRRVPIEDSQRMLSVALRPGELLRVPQDARNLQVLSGDAWISVDERDIVAQQGSRVVLPRTRYPVLVRGLRGQCLLLEAW